MKKDIVLLTGASSGIGMELAECFAREGHELVLVARSKEKLEELGAGLAGRYGVRTTAIACDLSVPNAAEQLAAELESRGLQADVLVNNAGYGLYGEFQETEWEREQQMMQLNMIALTQLTKRMLPGMLSRGRGRILNVASTASFQPGPLMAVYYATKAYVLSFSEAIAEELEGTGVTVTALCPGPTASGFQSAAAMEKSKLVNGSLPMMDARTVAEQGYAGMKRGERVVIPGIVNKLLVQSVRVTPRRLVTKLVKRMSGKV